VEVAGWDRSQAEDHKLCRHPPSMQGTGNGGAGRLASRSGDGSPIVPPPPSVQGMGNGGGGRGVGSLASGGSPVVPPPPAMQGTGHGGGGRLGALGGGGSQVVPPPPSMQGTGRSGAGRLGFTGGRWFAGDSSATIIAGCRPPGVEAQAMAGAGEVWDRRRAEARRCSTAADGRGRGQWWRRARHGFAGWR